MAIFFTLSKHPYNVDFMVTKYFTKIINQRESNTLDENYAVFSEAIVLHKYIIKGN